jgi:hypothetical protein
MTSNQSADGKPPTLDPDQTSEAQAPLPPQHPQLQKLQQIMAKLLKLRGWPWFAAIIVSWLAGVTALEWLSGLPPSANCKQLVTTLSETERLECADRLVRKGNPKDIQAALAMAAKWDKGHPLYPRVTILSNEWSREVLNLARRELDRGNLKEAIGLAKQVPENSSMQKESQRLIQQWEENWEAGKESLENARTAIKKQDWAQATLQVRALVQLDDSYWQDQADKILGDMAIEKTAFQDLYKAQDIADYGGADNLAKAIQLASKIDPKRLAKEEVHENIEKWSQTLLDLSEDYQLNGQFDEAIASAQKIPPNTKAAQEANTIMQLSQAEAVAKEGDFYGYLHAWALAEQVDADSALLEKNRERVEGWEEQIQNTGQLHLAKFFANIDTVYTYQLAIDHAALIDAEHPGRVDAQTLIAQWDQQIDTFQDRQILARARQFASQNTTAGYQAAIVEASKVEMGNPLRIDAQTLVAEWNGAIERVEDQPVLDQARVLAKAGKLHEAIEMAEGIESDRSLYRQAQDDIYKWVAEIQSVEDQPILNEAKALAQEGRLSEAIATASRIGYGRALYNEAQDRITSWSAERDAIYATRRSEEQPNAASSEEPSYAPESTEAAASPPEPVPQETPPQPSTDTFAPDPDGEVSRPTVIDPTAE